MGKTQENLVSNMLASTQREQTAEHARKTAGNRNPVPKFLGGGMAEEMVYIDACTIVKGWLDSQAPGK